MRIFRVIENFVKNHYVKRINGGISRDCWANVEIESKYLEAYKVMVDVRQEEADMLELERIEAIQRYEEERELFYLKSQNKSDFSHWLSTL
ncbi:hypothetical protein VHA01S_085_00240 [Vibrio halioticoli NBRC 102217]|uniref:Uncharacterized protein n=1 Tax=Vibrio halioticoli NBRC 102217 TaxID=1219072 RepID=V5FP57_9VIBR|nr:hypothetical protein [Vibrio halioticoli]GAD91346.1 hypothetical protein VHA01S_085_00240 [Vibrio halioticoli NBRC 102217]